MMSNDILQNFEPIGGYLVENPPFMGNAIGEDHIKGGDPVSGHDQQMFTQIINVPDLSPMKDRDFLEFRTQQDIGSHKDLTFRF
jgi:hypothetical protein